MLRILAEFEKGNRDRLLPITPDFVAFLRSTPEYARRGRVFTPTGIKGRPIKSLDTVKRRISSIGEAAAVVVDDRSGKFASAHDLRRTFGARWAPYVMPLTLKALMRHESIETTERYYVGQNAERTAAAVEDAYADLMGRGRGDLFGDHGDERYWKPDEKSSEILVAKELSKCPLEDSNLQPSD